MPKKIMIVEDDTDILDILTYILTDEGYEVISSTNSAILSEVTNDFPDLILLDNRLPEGLGIDICKRYKQQWKADGLSICPLIIISADHDLKLTAGKHEADGFIEKPFEVDQFVALVKKYVKN